MKFTSFVEMPLWQEAHKLVLDIYGLSALFPKEEVYGLTSQMRRSALSVSGNIAEAFGRFHYLDKNNFYFNARGSLEETRNYLIVSQALGYTTPEAFRIVMDNIDAISEELNALVKSLRLRAPRKPQPQSQSESQSESESQSQSQSESESKSKQ
jgi:four helix bundle protein